PSVTRTLPRTTLFPYTTLFRSFQWQKGGVDLSDDSHFSGTLTKMLAITGVTLDDADDYVCLITQTASGDSASTGAFTLYTVTDRSEEHTSELQSLAYLVCRLLL